MWLTCGLWSVIVYHPFGRGGDLPSATPQPTPHPMKILLVHKGDAGHGGAQIQMKRLCSGLRARGVGARILCRDATLYDSIRMPARPSLERWLRRITHPLGLNDIHLVSSFDLAHMPDFKDADLIDFHCFHHEALSYLALPALTAEKPAVFTFHDMWPFTGHCHASLECQRWLTGCGGCPHPEVAPAIRRDATALEWKLKRRAYASSRFTIVTPSMWLADLASRSMVADFEIVHIPHGIDTTVYQPLDKALCRRMLGIPPGSRVLVFGAESMARSLKGGDLLGAALNRLPPSIKRDTVLLIFGQADPAFLREAGMKTLLLGYLSNEQLKVQALSAADLFVNPTRAESFSLVVMESMACATPVASFAVGGVPELVRPGITGFLAEPESADSLAEAIVLALDDRAALKKMGGACRDVVMQEYPIELQAARYAQLYERVIHGRRGPSSMDDLPSTAAIQRPSCGWASM
jgi:glycosyltransferase involved in cell wall biosynthesis